jgi:hypothetical protein
MKRLTVVLCLRLTLHCEYLKTREDIFLSILIFWTTRLDDQLVGLVILSSESAPEISSTVGSFGNSLI